MKTYEQPLLILDPFAKWIEGLIHAGCATQYASNAWYIGYFGKLTMLADGSFLYKRKSAVDTTYTTFDRVRNAVVADLLAEHYFVPKEL